MFGPVSQAYRAMADTVVADAAAVQAIIDDLETTARVGAEAVAEPAAPGIIADIGAILVQVETDLATLSNDHYVGLSISRIGGPFLARTGEADARRMIGRLLTAPVRSEEHTSELPALMRKLYA